MPELVFSKGHEVLFRAPLTTRSLRLGHSPLNDLMLADDDVAAFQASVDREGGEYWLVDRSGQGTSVNGRPVERVTLRDGDVVQLGKLTARFDGAVGVPSNTQVHTNPLPSQQRDGAGQMYLVHDEKKFAVTETGVRVGKDEGNDLVIKDGHVSKFHALIFRRGGVTVVRDLGSRNGTYINSVRVTEGEAPAGCTITLGGVPLRLEQTGGEASKRKPRTEEKRVGELVYADAAMDAVAAAIRSVAHAPVEAAVCVLGESGTGKELVARAVHQLGPRASEPFVAVNCAALSPNLVESELFGHERGAFTGADRARAGAFEEAGEGTLFLDEVGDLPADAQAKLLRALEAREIRRVGGAGTKKVMCRVVTATHQNLLQRVHRGQYRSDLFHRLTALPIHVPPLRARPDDIPLLCLHFLKDFRGGRATLTEAALQKLMAHNYPGNVRELRNVLMKASVFSGKTQLDAKDIEFVAMPLADHMEAARVYQPGRTMADIEAEAIEQAIEIHGSHAAAARELGIARSTVINRVNQRRKKVGV
ncbi:MAG: sigma 54-interacting transcriptional regulator [Myxococcota bacterium]